jgi:hypothetical protein
LGSFTGRNSLSLISVVFVLGLMFFFFTHPLPCGFFEPWELRTGENKTDEIQTASEIPAF